MVDKIVGAIGPVRRTSGVAFGDKVVAAQPSLSKGSAISFDELLREKGIKLSAHAATRISGRNLEIGVGSAAKLETAVEKAKAKGSRECLVLMDNVAYLVSVKNQTVVTVVGKDELQERIFTSIDSVVIT